MKNSPAFIEFAFATSHLGAVLLPVNYRLSPEEFAYIHDHAGVTLIAADTEFAAMVEGFANAVLLDVDARVDTRTLAGDRAPAPPPVPRGPDDLYRLMYTSGTTAHPKGVMHSYGKFLLEVCGPRHRARALGFRPPAGVRPALPRRGLRPAGHRGAVDGRDLVPAAGVHAGGRARGH